MQKTGTVSVPADLLREVGVEGGQRVHWMLNPDLPGTLVLLPSTMVNRVMPEITKALRKKAR